MPSTRKTSKPKPKTAKQIAEEIQAERALEKQPNYHRKTKKRRAAAGDSNLDMTKQSRTGHRKPPPVPKDKTLEEIAEMDPDDPAFKHPQGAKRRYEGKTFQELTWKQSIRKAEQDAKNQKRAKIRKREAEIVKTEERVRLERGGKPVGKSKRVAVEERLLAEGLLNIDDWDDEELVKGYRRNRRGRFGPKPKYIPLEVQQECLRRIIRRGKSNLDGAYIKATELLVQLAQNAESEKVKLEALKEVMDRVAGKVPEHLKVQSEQAPYEIFLADSLEPLEEITQTTSNRQTQTEWELEFGEDEQPALEEGDKVLEAKVKEG